MLLNPEDMLLVPIILKSIAIIGLAIDMYGVWRLFKITPVPLEESPSEQFEATLSDFRRDEKAYTIVMDLNKNIGDLRHKTNSLNRRARKYFKIIVFGFFLQIISTLLLLFIS